MLTELHIEHLGVIERVEVVLGPGLTAVTGETGAGKTMIVEAIELLAGGRADSSIVRHGADEARIDGRIVTADGTETVLTRVIPADGRSRAYVDGRLATVATLAERCAGLVDLHGQHAHQSLLTTATQRAALDAYGSIDLEPLRAARASLTELDAELASLGGDEHARARELDLLRFQVAELDAAAVEDPVEDDRLADEEEVLGDAAAHRDAAVAALAALTAQPGDGVGGDVDARAQLARALQAVAGRAPFADVAERLAEVLADLDDLASELRARAESIEESPERLEAVRERRQVLRQLRRKYGDDLDAVIEFHREASERLDQLSRFDERAAEIDAERRRASDVERQAAAVVGADRRRVAPELAAAVEAELHRLAMPHASVAIDVGEHADDHPGDRVTFLLAANPGTPLLPLNRVASGGELARAMLALRLVLGASTPEEARDRTLIFDEVDAGIGGVAAQAIGEALAALGRSHQVLVVTHLAQVAAAADAQLQVAKSVTDGAATARVTVLDGAERTAEIARMLSGETSPSALEHARTLLAR